MTAVPHIIQMAAGPLETNCYAVICPETGEVAIIDPGAGAEAILSRLPDETTVRMVLLTHGHFDHVGAVREVAQATGAPVGIHPDDALLMSQAPAMARLFGVEMTAPPAPDFQLQDGQKLQVGRLTLEVLHTPGHSAGGVTFALPGTAIVGDCLFAGSIGRTDLPGSDYRTLMRSIVDRILSLPDETRVLPGHGPSTTVGRERQTNPFISDYLSDPL
ncbi:MAG: MBL fold metallo-hydrolase [Armatimonadota bacterium]|nr:MAG: MBL fold metallo-hydrolase [Armatimonadota bacterium]